jgi:hypothetical protein
MTKVTESEFNTKITNLFPDNVTRLISPMDLRDPLDDIPDSIQFLPTTGNTFDPTDINVTTNESFDNYIQSGNETWVLTSAVVGKVQAVKYQSTGTYTITPPSEFNTLGTDIFSYIEANAGVYEIMFYAHTATDIWVSCPRAVVQNPGAGSVLVMPSLETLTLTELAPTISLAGGDITISPSLETLTLTELAPTINVVSNAFDPDTITNNLFLLDATGGSDITLDPGVRIDWFDQNTNSHDFSNLTSAEFPVYGSDWLTFDGADHLETGVDGATPFGTFDMHKGNGATIIVVVRPDASIEDDDYHYIIGNRHNTTGTRGFCLWLDDRSSQSMSLGLKFQLSNGSSLVFNNSLSGVFTADEACYLIIRVEDGHSSGDDLSILQGTWNGSSVDLTEIIATSAANAFSAVSEVNRELWIGSAEDDAGNEFIGDIRVAAYYNKWIEDGSEDLTNLTAFLDPMITP